jgi:hypothetical protein
MGGSGMMNYEWRKALDAMRKEGYAVCVITPDELDGLDPRKVEGCLTLGFETLSKRPDVNEILENNNDD